MKVQTDQEVEQNKTKKMNKKYNMQMFSLRVQGSKAIAAEHKGI